MTVSAHDVARELRRRCRGEIGAIKLHKLLYYVQGWNLAAYGEPAFPERIQAWTKGPVVVDLWADEKYGRSHADPSPLSVEVDRSVDYVVRRYDQFSGATLIRMTHDEDPWRDATEVDDPLAPADPEIAHEALMEYFRRDDAYLAHRLEVDRLHAVMKAALSEPLEDDRFLRVIVESSG